MLPEKHNNPKAILFLVILFFIFLPALVLASSTNGTIDSTYKYAWSENIGWINFGTEVGNVVVTDSGLTGYAWSQNYGRINLAPSISGVTNDGAGILSGSAWGENTGLIDFSGVTIDSDGYFNGYANGDITGQINFNCANNNACDGLDYKVRTDWRPQTVRPACNNALDDDSDGLIDYPTDKGCESLTDTNEINPGGLPPSAQNPPTPPAPSPKSSQGEFKIIINNKDEYTNKKDVKLKLSGGTDTTKMSISNFADFKNATQIPYQKELEWNLSQEDGQKIVYAKFYTEYGQPSEPVSDTIILDTITPDPPTILYPTSNSTIKTDNPTFKGTGQPKNQIVLELSSNNLILVQTYINCGKDGNWSYSLPKPLSDENYQLKVYSKNLAQNVSETTLTNFTIITFVFPPQQTTQDAPEPIISTSPTEQTPPSPTGEKQEPIIEESQTTELEPPIDPSYEQAQTPQPATQLEPNSETSLESPLLEVVEFNSICGNICLNPFASQDLTAKQEETPTIHALPSQMINLSVRPAKPVLAVVGQILFHGETAQLEPENQSFPLSQKKTEKPSFLNILKPKPAFAQSEIEPKQELGGGWKIQEFTYFDEDNNGVYKAKVPMPVATNLYTLKTLLYYKDGTLKSLDAPLLIDPQGYVYEKIENQELRINNAVISLYSLNPNTEQYELWNSSSYDQKNPQTTNKDGAYSFLAPEGKYYITVQAENYKPFESEKFDVKEGIPIVNFNLELKKEKKAEIEKKFDWIKIIGFAVGVISLLAMGWYARSKKKRV